MISETSSIIDDEQHEETTDFISQEQFETLQAQIQVSRLSKIEISILVFSDFGRST